MNHPQNSALYSLTDFNNIVHNILQFKIPLNKCILIVKAAWAAFQSISRFLFPLLTVLEEFLYIWILSLTSFVTLLELHWHLKQSRNQNFRFHLRLKRSIGICKQYLCVCGQVCRKAKSSADLSFLSTSSTPQCIPYFVSQKMETIIKVVS